MPIGPPMDNREHRFRPISTVLHLLRLVKLHHPEQLRFECAVFDQLAGNSWIREMLDNGDTVERIVAQWQRELEVFRKKRSKHLLY